MTPEDVAAIRDDYEHIWADRRVLALCYAWEEQREQLEKRAQGSSYDAAHKRLYVVRGKALDHKCAHCDKQAETWAYDGEDEGVRVSGQGWLYSDDPMHYLPLCKSCHSWFDAPKECAQGHPYDDKNTFFRKSGYRACRECNRLREGKRSALKKENAKLRSQLEEAWAVIADQTRDFGIRMDMKEERAERAEAQLEWLRGAKERAEAERDDKPEYHATSYWKKRAEKAEAAALADRDRANKWSADALAAEAALDRVRALCDEGDPALHEALYIRDIRATLDGDQ